MLDFDESAHKFQVVPQTPQLALEFGTRLFFTSLTTGLPVTGLEASLAVGGAAFNSFLVFPALLFFAEAVALVPQGSNPQAAEGHFRRNFEFGFVQGIRENNIHIEYWGSTRALGRTIVDITMPQVFEVDTEASIQPWTPVATSRFKVTGKGGGRKLLFFKVEADFADHPMLILPHTLTHATSGLTRFLRWVKFTRDFRTIFCFRDKSDGSFTPISSTAWTVSFDHLVSYTGNGTSHSVDNRIGAPGFPRGGSPSNVQSTDRDILAMAKRGAPLETPPVLNRRLHDPALRTETDETPNADFDPAFWR